MVDNYLSCVCCSDIEIWLVISQVSIANIQYNTICLVGWWCISLDGMSDTY